MFFGFFLLKEGWYWLQKAQENIWKNRAVINLLYTTFGGQLRLKDIFPSNCVAIIYVFLWFYKLIKPRNNINNSEFENIFIKMGFNLLANKFLPLEE